MVKTYVRKPEPIQAIQWTGDNLEEIRERKRIFEQFIR